METTPIYNVTMAVLYMMCRMGWVLCGKHLASFTAYKSLYTQAFIDAQLQAIKDAAAIDNENSRNAQGNNMRIDAEEATRLLCANWQALKTYIEQAFKGRKLDNILLMAGSESYAKTAVFNWAETQVLISLSDKFITDNLAALTGAGYMPNAFATKFTDDAKDCLEKCNDYMINNGDKRNVTEDKVAANNAIYTSLVSMLKDARQVFRSKEGIKNQYSAQSLKVLASGNGAGSLRGRVFNPETGKAVDGVSVTFVNSNEVRTTNKRGGYSVARLAAGSYKIQFSKEGFEPQTITATIDTGTLATFNVNLEPAAMAVAAFAEAEQLKVA